MTVDHGINNTWHIMVLSFSSVLLSCPNSGSFVAPSVYNPQAPQTMQEIFFFLRCSRGVCVFVIVVRAWQHDWVRSLSCLWLQYSTDPVLLVCWAIPVFFLFFFFLGNGVKTKKECVERGRENVRFVQDELQTSRTAVGVVLYLLTRWQPLVGSALLCSRSASEGSDATFAAVRPNSCSGIVFVPLIVHTHTHW